MTDITIDQTTTARTVRFAMSPRELIDIGVFASLYLVTSFVFVLVGLIAPPLMPFSLALGIIAAAIPFTLYLTRVTHAGQVFLFVLVAAGLQLLTGHPIPGVMLALTLAIAVELVLHLGGYRRKATSIAACTLFSAWSIGPFLPMLYAGHDEMLGGRLSKLGGAQFVQFDTGTIALVLLGMMLVMMVFGLLGGLLATRLLRKHFVRAGLA